VLLRVGSSLPRIPLEHLLSIYVIRHMGGDGPSGRPPMPPVAIGWLFGTIPATGSSVPRAGVGGLGLRSARKRQTRTPRGPSAVD
jgi:hypothetical protein